MNEIWKKSISYPQLEASTERLARNIKELLNFGKTTREIHNATHISIHIINDIKRGKTWKTA